MNSRSRILVREMIGKKRLRINWTVVILVTLEFPVTNSRVRENFFYFGLCRRGRGWDDLGEWHWTCIISYRKWITSPGSIQDAWGWCTGMTWRDGMGKEVGGGFRMGNTRTPMADSCWYMAEPIQYCKVK